MEPRPFSDRVLGALEIGQKITDGACPGLAARRLRSGVTFEWRGRVRGRKCTLRLGMWIGRGDGPRFSMLTVEAARARAAHVTAVVRDGGDPRGGRRLAPTTTGEALGRYEREHMAHRRQGVKTMRLLHRVLPPGRPLAEVGREEIREALAPFAERGQWASVHSVRAKVLAFLRWAEGEELGASAPANMRVAAPVRRRAHVPTLVECRSLWEAAAELGPRKRAFVRVLMLGGFRRGEVAGLEWAEVREEECRIVLPPERTKQAREHVVPLLCPMWQELQG
jgi:hypothetical protein